MNDNFTIDSIIDGMSSWPKNLVPLELAALLNHSIPTSESCLQDSRKCPITINGIRFVPVHYVDWDIISTFEETLSRKLTGLQKVPLFGGKKAKQDNKNLVENFSIALNEFVKRYRALMHSKDLDLMMAFATTPGYIMDEAIPCLLPSPFGGCPDYEDLKNIRKLIQSNPIFDFKWDHLNTNLHLLPHAWMLTPSDRSRLYAIYSPRSVRWYIECCHIMLEPLRVVTHIDDTYNCIVADIYQGLLKKFESILYKPLTKDHANEVHQYLELCLNSDEIIDLTPTRLLYKNAIRDKSPTSLSEIFNCVNLHITAISTFNLSAYKVIGKERISGNEIDEHFDEISQLIESTTDISEDVKNETRAYIARGGKGSVQLHEWFSRKELFRDNEDLQSHFTDYFGQRGYFNYLMGKILNPQIAELDTFLAIDRPGLVLGEFSELFQFGGSTIDMSEDPSFATLRIYQQDYAEPAITFKKILSKVAEKDPEAFNDWYFIDQSLGFQMLQAGNNPYGIHASGEIADELWIKAEKRELAPHSAANTTSDSGAYVSSNDTSSNHTAQASQEPVRVQNSAFDPTIQLGKNTVIDSEGTITHGITSNFSVDSEGRTNLKFGNTTYRSDGLKEHELFGIKFKTGAEKPSKKNKSWSI